MVKLWWDERVIAGSLQTVAGLSPIWPPVPNHNSWIHFIPFLLRDQKCASTVYEVMILSGLFEVFKEIKDTRYEIPDERPTPRRFDATKVEMFIVADWMCFYGISTDCDAPSSNDILQKLCPCCNFNVGDKIGGWRRNPWFWYQRVASREGSLRIPNLTMSQCLYDPMHGIARLFSAVMMAFWTISSFLRSSLPLLHARHGCALRKGK